MTREAPSKQDKIFLLMNRIDSSSIGGRELLSKLNHDILKMIYADQCIVYELPKNPIRGMKNVMYSFKGYIDGLTLESMAYLLDLIELKKINKIFVDGSNLGGFIKIVKKKFPKIKVYTFFHNVESRFFLGSFKQGKTLRAFGVLAANYLAERKAVNYSDTILCINERDSQLLKKIYGRFANDIYPMSLEDKFHLDDVSLSHQVEEKFALFVGGNFYANRVGIFWFVEHVVPYISVKTYIVGRGFEEFREKLEINEKVVVVGEVDTLAQWYHDAYFVIAPIFDGSGMKTKVAEALMYGKKIIGTPEAFKGYEEITEEVGKVCHSSDEFIAAIESSGDLVDCSFDTKLRKIYKEKYSLEAAKLRLESIMS